LKVKDLRDFVVIILNRLNLVFISSILARNMIKQVLLALFPQKLPSQINHPGNPH